MLIVVLGVSCLVFVGAAAVGLWRYANADHLGILDDPPVTDRAAAACRTLQDAVADVAPGPPSDTIRAEDAAIDDLVASMEQLGDRRLHGDDPAEAWVADWRMLRDLRERYADELAAGHDAAFVLPTVDGIPITSRMRDPGVECPVAVALGSPPQG